MRPWPRSRRQDCHAARERAATCEEAYIVGGATNSPAEAQGPRWAAGDFPMRAGCQVEPLIDGRAAMFAMCLAFLTARRYILLAAWDVRADLPMVRGGDARVGADGSPEQEEFLATLREEGLDEDAIVLWRSEQLRVVDVLGYAARRGARVGVLLWDAYHGMSHLTNSPEAERGVLVAAGVDCLLDDSSRQITHIAQSLHQKCAVVDGRVAFLGGIDLTVQASGDYDRWDTHHHPCASTERSTKRSASAHPWHDLHARVQGPVVADVLENIVQRWTDVAARHTASTWPASLVEAPPAPIVGCPPAQIVRTIPPHTYRFAPSGIATIKDMYLSAFAAARTFVYLENQYLWPEIFVGLDTLRWGARSPDMMELLESMAAALRRGVRIALTLPDHPNCGRRFTDAGAEWLRERAEQAGTRAGFQMFTLGSSLEDETIPGGIFYRPVYTHAKVAIVDDAWWTVGSANLNSRGLRSDAEINVAVLDPERARDLRLRLWVEHARYEGAQQHALHDPLAGLDALATLAAANREHVARRAPLEGHLLPYLTEADGRRLGLAVHQEHGWLDNRAGGVGALPEGHAQRYI